MAECLLGSLPLHDGKAKLCPLAGTFLSLAGARGRQKHESGLLDSSYRTILLDPKGLGFLNKRVSQRLPLVMRKIKYLGGPNVYYSR